MSQTVEKNIVNGFGGFYKIPVEKFFQVAMSVDCVIFGYTDQSLKVLIIDRGAYPYEGEKALPGDLVYPNEEINFAARRVLQELTGIKSIDLNQTKSYGNVSRHPIGRVVTIGYYALVSSDNYNPVAQSWAGNTYWVDINEIPELAFDHNLILNDALENLQEKVRNRPIGFELLPKKFTLGEMQALYESILNEKFDKANFRKRMLSMGFLVDLGEYATNVRHRPPRLFSFDQEKYNSLISKGFSFSL